MKKHLFVTVLTFVLLLGMLASAQAGPSVPLPNPAASSPQQGRLATPTPKPPSRGAGATSSTSVSSTLYFPFVAGGVPPLPPIIPPTTKPLTTDTIQYLSSISSDGSVFTFTQTTPQLSGLCQAT